MLVGGHRVHALRGSLSIQGHFEQLELHLLIPEFKCVKIVQNVNFWVNRPFNTEQPVRPCCTEGSAWHQPGTPQKQSCFTCAS